MEPQWLCPIGHYWFTAAPVWLPRSLDARSWSGEQHVNIVELHTSPVSSPRAAETLYLDVYATKFLDCRSEPRNYWTFP